MPTTLLKTNDGDAAQAEPDKAAATAATNPARFIGKPEVLDRVCASYPSIWQWMREGKFPRSRELGGKAVWLESEIETWIVNRPIRRLKAIGD
jgi:prophage regulatory protein